MQWGQFQEHRALKCCPFLEGKSYLQSAYNMNFIAFLLLKLSHAAPPFTCQFGTNPRVWYQVLPLWHSTVEALGQLVSKQAGIHSLTLNTVGIISNIRA